jgi:hypothetical protein
VAVPFAQAAFTVGEVAPGLYGRADLARYKVAASTVRNMFPKFSGGAYSRAGTSFAGFSKQTGKPNPPRVIAFQSSVDQGLMLEFGQHYMRVVTNGAYVTEGALAITNITQGNPAVVTVTAVGATAAVPINTGVTSSYDKGDLITLAGGIGAPAVLEVASSEIHGLELFAPGEGVYAPADTITLDGGTHTTAGILTVTHTQVVAATVVAGGAGGTDGTQTVTGTTGTGTKFQASVTVAGATITAVLGVTVAGDYTVNPTVPAVEPVTGAGLVGATLNLEIGVLDFTITTAGVYQANPITGTFTQASTSGTGTQASFSNALMAPHAVTVRSPGAYSTRPPNPVAQSSTTGVGEGATFTVTMPAIQPFQDDDWINITAVDGMTQVNGQTYVVGNATPTTFSLFTVYGDPVDSSAFTPYAAGGFAARIYTTESPYLARDLKWLKWTQSADVMSICCVNQDTKEPYQSYDLKRFSDTDWQFDPIAPEPTIGPPGSTSGSASGGGAVFYQYVVTAVNPEDGSESIASPIAYIDNAVNVSATAGTITIHWASVAQATTYRIYKAPVTFSTRAPLGIPFGLVGQAEGTSFADSGFVPDFNTVPSQAKNPFDTPADYPSTVSYFQARRVYANTLAQPDTYFMSQPGSFTNFDTRNPTIDSDAITGSPWSVQVSGIQFMVDMPGGLVVLTGHEAWQLTGTGGSSFNPQPVTPSTQQAQPQAFNGCSNHVPPIRIDYDILYVQAKGSIVRDLGYQFYQNIYTGIDLTLNSSHLFTGYKIEQWAWAEEPYKLVWAVRDDGAMLSLTFVKAEQIAAWARHDTNGYFRSVCAVTERPVDAIYVAVERTIGGRDCYTIERMDNRIWSSVDDAWCVDCGLSLEQPAPDSTLTISSATGLGECSGATINDGGSNWSAGAQFSVVDGNGQGPGTGAVPIVTITDGVITNVTFTPGGTDYVSPKLVGWDPAGSEGGNFFDIEITLSNTIVLTAGSPIFLSTDVSSVVRAAGGSARITGFTNSKHVTADVIVPFTATIPDSEEALPRLAAGNWTMTAPVSTVTGLNHLIGAVVTGVADGEVIPPQIVSENGTIALDRPATNVVIGLGFVAQLQSLYLDAMDNPTIQGQRKRNAAVTARVEASRGFMVGANQPDGGAQSPIQIAPAWHGLTEVPSAGVPPYGQAAQPLFTGDVRVPLPGGYDTRGQIAFQQSAPLPMNVLALVTEYESGDQPQKGRKPKGQPDEG